MEQKLQLCVFALLVQVSLAVWQRVTVIKGQTFHLTCPITNAHQLNVDWKTHDGYIMFFKNKKVHKGLKDKRYSVNKLSQSEFTISISDVTFKDGGNYTCSQYGDDVTEKTVELTVLDHPKMRKTKHEGRFVIKCTAEGNHHPPQIFWKFDHGPEIIADSQVLREDRKFVSTAMISVQSVENRVTVKCLVRHPALRSQPLMDFVTIGQKSAKSRHATTTSPPTTQPQRSTEAERTTTGWFRLGRTTVYLPTTDVNGPSSGSSAMPSAVPSNQLFSTNEPKADKAPTDTSTGSHLSTSHNSGTSVLSVSTWSTNDTTHNATSTSGNLNVPKTQTGTEGSSSLLVFLVTCLIVALLVVVIFFTIKLRRAHITWKRENEESDPSEESSKSKSSQEEKNFQGKKRRGLFNTAFTQYVNEEAPVRTSVINTAARAATEGGSTEQTPQPETSRQTSAKCDIKETEL